MQKIRVYVRTRIYKFSFISHKINHSLQWKCSYTLYDQAVDTLTIFPIGPNTFLKSKKMIGFIQHYIMLCPQLHLTIIKKVSFITVSMSINLPLNNQVAYLSIIQLRIITRTIRAFLFRTFMWTLNREKSIFIRNTISRCT